MASLLDVHPQALYRLLRALASLGIFAETDDGRFELTPLAETLRSDMPGSLRGLALLYGEESLWRAYGRTSYSATSGLPAFDLVHGGPIFGYLGRHPAAASRFDEAMTAFSCQEAAAIFVAHDFSGAERVVDVGGGQGALLDAILAAHPRARGVLLDRQGVVERALDLMTREGVVDRCELVAIVFFERAPGGGNVYVLKSVLHDRDDARSTAILKNCREAMGPRFQASTNSGANRARWERFVGGEPFDIKMLVVTCGLERTEGEYRTIFAPAGFELTRIVPTNAPVCVIEGMPLTG